jgi:xylan 1,4-beta-xylosidase
VEAEYRMDALHSNAFRAWQKMGRPAHPSAEQIERLQKAGALEQTVADHRVTVDKGKFSLPLTIPRQGLLLVRLMGR